MKNLLFFSISALLLLCSCSAQRAAVADSGNGTVHATKTLKMSEKDNRGYSNIYDYLRGKVPGVDVRGTQITIRGINSVNSQSFPLILVDGVEMQDISSISPMEVDHVEVIKDASASSYGFRASGGVIKITTKAENSKNQ